jgi:hypothetical protein
LTAFKHNAGTETEKEKKRRPKIREGEIIYISSDTRTLVAGV